MSTTTAIDHPSEATRYRVTGMDCPSCATKIEKAAHAVPGVEEVTVSIASGIMTLRPLIRPLLFLGSRRP